MSKKRYISFLLLFCSFSIASFGQETLPAITVKNLNGKIVLSWLNTYKKPIQNILIQRSYDSLRNFSTVGTVLNPLNTENGFPDANPPYNKMYYRLNIIFEGGAYVIGPSTRPIKEWMPLEEFNLTAIPESTIPHVTTSPTPSKELQQVSIPDIKSNAAKINEPKVMPKIKPNKVDSIISLPPKRVIETAYPSNRVFTSKYNTVVIQVNQANTKKYTLKIFDENEKIIMELKQIPEEYLILEKANFIRSGWYRFELYENGELYEKNKFFIGKDKAK